MFTDPATASAAAESVPSETFRVELEPEIVVPAQFFTGFRHDASVSPEKRLMLAVLEESVIDFQKHAVATGREGTRVFREVEEWFASEDRVWPFGFARICETLGLEASWIRSGLARWRDAQRGRYARGERLVRLQLRRVAGYRSKATGRAVRGRARSRW